jgi:RNA polymerase sigma factor (sigma-70 family)
MSASITTRVSLLERVRDPQNHDAWAEFVALYRPLIYRFGRARGLQEADAHDLAQDVLIAVSQQIDQWTPDPGRGRFRTWLARVASNQAITMYRRRHASDGVGGTTMVAVLHNQPEQVDADLTELQKQYQRELFRRAARIVREEFEESTWQAFWMTAVEDVAIDEVARSLARSVGSVYTARSRVIRRLQEIVHKLDADDDSLAVPRALGEDT